MAYTGKEAKELVIKAGKILVESGLIARTWGNISARISDTQFVITPSGLAYETLSEEQIVVVNIADCTYEGNIKPSSEKGIHADTYRLRPEINFVVHTHQEKASVISMDGEELKIVENAQKLVLGEVVPCAPYGISSTKKLKKAVEMTLTKYPVCKAILMKHHGTLCLGESLEHAFEIAQTLEQAANKKFINVCGTTLNALNGGSQGNVSNVVEDFGSSSRTRDSFLLNHQGKEVSYQIHAMPEDATKVALLHALIYQKTKMQWIIHTVDEDIVWSSSAGKRLPAYIDDLAQIAGVNIPIIQDGEKNAAKIAKILKHKNAVFLELSGALCTGRTKSDAQAVGMVLKKGCVAQRYATAKNKKMALHYLDAILQRFVYTVKYSKQKK